VRLPVVAGATFTVLNPMIIIANQYGGRAGLPYVHGALIISGIFGLLVAKPFSMVLRFFPPLVTGRGHPDDRPVVADGPGRLLQRR
jgi:xanthine/uracil permease